MKSLFSPVILIEGSPVSLDILPLADSELSNTYGLLMNLCNVIYRVKCYPEIFYLNWNRAEEYVNGAWATNERLNLESILAPKKSGQSERLGLIQCRNAKFINKRLTKFDKEVFRLLF